LACARACYQFFDWCEENALTLDKVQRFQVAANIEQMPGSKPTVKQKLAAIRMLYDFLVIQQLVPVNPTACPWSEVCGQTRQGPGLEP
jgi:integrase/recombinase XerD